MNLKSQFHYSTSTYCWLHDDRKHTCFGKVVEGLEVIDLVREGDKIQSVKIIQD